MGEEIPLTSAKSEGENSSDSAITTDVRSLKELLDRVTGQGSRTIQPVEDSGLAEVLPFPFLALVGQREMKTALLLSLINPSVGGVLLIGPRGTGKTSAVRGLVDLLPMVPRSLCYYGCTPEDIEAGGIDAVCPDCAQKYARGEALVKMDKVRLVELPLNARLEDVIGSVDERAAIHERMRVKRGLLAQADRNLLYIDEINLLSGEVVDALLDAAAQGMYTVRRGPVSATYWSRFVLIGSMNPEEGRLRPQIQDRFGLRVVVRGLSQLDERFEAYKRARSYLENRRRAVAEFGMETQIAQAELQSARNILHEVVLPEEVAKVGLELINRLKIDSLRAEITLFEAARAYAAADARRVVNLQDLGEVALMSLRLRRSEFINAYFDRQQQEDDEISQMKKRVFSSED